MSPLKNSVGGHWTLIDFKEFHLAFSDVVVITHDFDKGIVAGMLDLSSPNTTFQAIPNSETK